MGKAQDDAAHKVVTVRCVGGVCWGILLAISQRRRRDTATAKEEGEKTSAGRGKEKCEKVRESEKAGGAVGRRG
jgi:hypothetical protein